jgi:hypothetical protein
MIISLRAKSKRNYLQTRHLDRYVLRSTTNNITVLNSLLTSLAELHYVVIFHVLSTETLGCTINNCHEPEHRV